VKHQAEYISNIYSITSETFTRSLCPNGSQKVTALPCMITPHCSPSSQLLQSDLRRQHTHTHSTQHTHLTAVYTNTTHTAKERRVSRTRYWGSAPPVCVRNHLGEQRDHHRPALETREDRATVRVCMCVCVCVCVCVSSPRLGRRGASVGADTDRKTESYFT